MTSTAGQIYDSLRMRLSPKFGDNEALAMARLVMENVLNYSPVDIILNRDTEIPDFITEKTEAIIDRLLADEPLQYILGTARFCGMTLNVTPDVLIPRPETEELVDIITDRWSTVPDLRVLDLGTGSGCIAIALARALRFPQVTAVDISAGALEVARGNSRGLRAKITFLHDDMLTMPPGQDSFDIIVSNPPYIAMSERASMAAHVKDREPAEALFVPDADPLMFYRAIARYASSALTARGALYLEINPLYADGLKRLLADEGFTDVTILPDMQRLDRFAIATRHR